MNLKTRISECIELMHDSFDLSEQKKLVIIQVGDDPASNMYIKSKLKEASKWNIECEVKKFEKEFPSDFVQEQIENEIQLCNKTNTPVIVQLPLPYWLSEQKILNCIKPSLNVDGFHQNGKEDFRYFIPCTPLGIITFLHYITNLKGKTVVVIGRGETVGKPLVKLLLNESCTVTECNSYTPKSTLKSLLKGADIVISAVGKPNLFCADDLKTGCIVVDAGISRVNGKQVGDFSHEGDLSKIIYTPWTNGVGKLTVASLMLNVRRR